MAKPTLTAFVLTMLAAASAQAQVSIDVSRITCEQFAPRKILEPDKIAIWLNGYQKAKRGDTVIDMRTLEQSAKMLRDFCRNNSTVTVMQAVDALLATKK